MFKKSIVLIIGILLLSSIAFSETDEVNIALPEYEIELNGVIINNDFREFPFIVYDDLTYIPLVYIENRFLGLESNYSESDGITLNKTGIVAEHSEYIRAYKNNKSYIAQIFNGTITINDNIVDNSKEEYPILTFRELVYIPLTWKFAVDEFDWNYTFDDNRLKISSNSNPVKRLKLPFQRKGGVVPFMYEGYYYYSGIDNGIGSLYKAAISNPDDAVELLKLNKYPGDYNPNVIFFEQDGNLFAKYRDYINALYKEYIIHEDGTTELKLVLESYYGFSKSYDDGVTLHRGTTNNIYYNDISYLGSPDYSFGRTREVKLGRHNSWYTENNDVEFQVVGDWIYIVGYKICNIEDTGHLYKINKHTNEIALVSDIPVYDFLISDNTLYMQEFKDRKLYVRKLDEAVEEILIDDFVRYFDVVDGKLYYSISGYYGLDILSPDGTTEVILPDLVASKITIYDEYIVRIDPDLNYGLVVCKLNGEIVLKTSITVDDFSLDGNIIVFSPEYKDVNYKVELDK